MELTSTKNATVLYAASLKDKKYRDKEGKYLIEGEHLVNMAGDELECIFTTDHTYEHDYKPVYHVNEAIIRKLSFVQAPQGIVAIVKKKANEINYNLNRYLLCDGVADPGNMGTIIRTALAFNVDMVILANGSVDIYNDKVIRGSQGAILSIPVVYTNMDECVKKLQENGVKVYASTLSKRSINLKDVKEVNRFALVVGNEGCGVSQSVQDASDFNVKIAHSDCIDSLNVGVATSIMLYYFDSISK